MYLELTWLLFGFDGRRPFVQHPKLKYHYISALSYTHMHKGRPSLESMTFPPIAAPPSALSPSTTPPGVGLQELEVMHPAAKLIVMAAKSQESHAPAFLGRCRKPVKPVHGFA